MCIRDRLIIHRYAMLGILDESGLPQDVLDALPEAPRLRLPMRPDNRSLNLSNAVAVLVFEAWRQHDFDGGA